MNHGKNVRFDSFQVRCAHKSGDVINVIIVACRISSRLKWYKNYKNRLRLAEVIVKNKMSRFLWFTVYNVLDGTLNIAQPQLQPDRTSKGIRICYLLKIHYTHL